MKLLRKNKKPIPQQPKKSGVEFHTIHTLMMDKFLIAICEHDYSVLVKSGEPTAEEVSKAWDGIMEQYATQTGGFDSKFIHTCLKEIQLLKINITEASIMLRIIDISPAHNDEIIPRLHKLGFTYKFDVNDTVQYESDVRKVIAKVKNWKVRMMGTEKELDDFFKQSGSKTVKINREYFDDMIVELSKFLGISVRESDITLGRYIAMVKRLKKHHQQLSKQLLKMQTNGK